MGGVLDVKELEVGMGRNVKNGCRKCEKGGEQGVVADPGSC